MKHLRARLTVSSWRHVAIAIERDVVQGMESDELDDGEEEPSDLQAGHSGAVAQHHYGVRSDLLVSLSDKTIRRFRAVSERWHAYLSMEPLTTIPASTVVRPATTTTTSQSVASNANISMASPLGDHPSVDPHTSSPAAISPGTGSLAPTDPRVSPLLSPIRKRRRVDPLPSLDPGADDQAAAFLEKHRPGLHTYRSDMQRKAVLSLLGSSNDLIVMLPTAGGKTLLCYMQAKAFPRVMTIVVIPFTALLEETLQYCVGQGISAIEWKHGITSQHAMVLVSAELAVSAEFLGYARKAESSDILNMVIFDEAHTILKDAGWRECMRMLHR